MHTEHERPSCAVVLVATRQESHFEAWLWWSKYPLHVIEILVRMFMACSSWNSSLHAYGRWILLTRSPTPQYWHHPGRARSPHFPQTNLFDRGEQRRCNKSARERLSRNKSNRFAAFHTHQAHTQIIACTRMHACMRGEALTYASKGSDDTSSRSTSRLAVPCATRQSRSISPTRSPPLRARP